MLNTPFPDWPAFTEEEVEAVARVLRSGRVNAWTGDECATFEREFADACQASNAIAVANGTLALDLALHGLGIGPGDEVIVTPRSFIASVSAVANAGATPVFADVDRDTQNLSADTISPHISPKTKAITCVHLAGLPCDLDPILSLANKHSIKVIEDCAQAHGATYKGRSVGTIGDVGTWSFCQDKIITTGGEGGMVTTNDSNVYDRMWAYKDHGKSLQAVKRKDHPPGFRWLHESFGTNFRMTEMQAAIGRIQLRRLPDTTRIRRANAEQIWNTATACLGLRVPPVPNWAGHAAYKCYVFVEPEKLATDWSRDRIMNEISTNGVPCFSGSCSEIYREKAFDGTSWKPDEALPNAAELGHTSLMFMVHPTLHKENIDKTCQALTEIMARAGRGS